jgi:GT2 family glycosyltransferase
MNIAVLLTVHNRREKTLAAIDSVFQQEDLHDVQIKIYVVDDGCVDGTPQAITSKYPNVIILPGGGDLFWNGGMRKAFEAALSFGYDFYFWLNDDTLLFADSIKRLLVQSRELGPKTILVGSTYDSITKIHTYGGVKRISKLRPLKFMPILPGEKAIPADTMNGNCVLIPSKVVEVVGNLDPSFTHGMGDYDYGLRARLMGFSIMIASGYFGVCNRNDKKNTWMDPEESPGKRWSNIRLVNRLPIKEWAIFSRRYAGFFWPIYWASPYIKTILPSRIYLDGMIKKILSKPKG